jgi:hypothetical protein
MVVSLVAFWAGTETIGQIAALIQRPAMQRDRPDQAARRWIA